MKAYQRIIREKLALVEPVPDIRLDPHACKVKQVPISEIKDTLLKYEWLKCLHSINLFAYGLYFENYLAAATTYGPDYVENLGVWNKYNFTGKIILLSRGCCVHWAPPYCASKLIRGSMDLLPKKYEVVTATVDELAGEIGTVYQAAGFYYVGVMRKTPTRIGILHNGKLYGSRSLRAKFGTQKLEEIIKQWSDAKVIMQKSKARYFAFRGSHKVQKQHYEAIAHLIRPYPKREVK